MLNFSKRLLFTFILPSSSISLLNLLLNMPKFNEPTYPSPLPSPTPCTWFETLLAGISQTRRYALIQHIESRQAVQ
ncbi:hypothetical protein K432DRAFT_376926 [Lepidopterella palustris CBS 459.81]|uniref:Secreted protein n=1 Tax=Lepidopterella palustris CBS 459.81 TaxID=1314670 RepID=A0A8E2EM22_9PEZI|nr:hypothetical protein K432DRAFT_376926 [Lepidopterella palustris CBS 459.81]